MSDSSVAITAGAGTSISTRTNGSGEHMQVVMLGRDGDDGVLDPAALGDGMANPTTLGLGAHLLVWDALNGQWVRWRAPVAFKTVDLSAGTAETTIWTPASGKRFRLLGLFLQVGSSASKLTFRDGTGGAVILVLGAGANDNTGPVDLGPVGLASGAANNALTVQRATSTTLVGTLWGVEES